MDEIRREAMDDYEQKREEQKQYPLDFFKAMDSDGNGNISIHGALIRSLKVTKNVILDIKETLIYGNKYFYTLFTELDKDKNGTLDYEELITLFFIFNHDKYRDRFAAASSNVNNHKETKDESFSIQGRSGGPDAQVLLDLFLKLCNIGVNAANLAIAGGCSIM